jgi:hypothetical protein
MTPQQRVHFSPHFTRYELTRSGTAIEHDLRNEPNLQQEQALRNLAINILEPLRQQFGPIVISSGFRTSQVNRLVGGVANSQHMRGEAADLVVGDTERALALFHFIKTRLDFDQLIWEPVGATEPRWLHVSYTKRHTNRHQII